MKTTVTTLLLTFISIKSYAQVSKGIDTYEQVAVKLHL